LGAGILAYFAGDFAAAQRQFAAARKIGALQNDDITQGYATFMLGTVQTLSNNKAAGAALLDQGYARLSQAGTAATWHVGVTSLARVLLSFELGRLDDAQHFADVGMRIFQRLGQPYGIGLAFNYQGDVARLRNDAATAAASYQAALPLLRQANARSEIPAVLHNLAHVLLLQGESTAAYTTFVEALELHREIGNRMGMTECLIGLAATVLANQQPQVAATLLGTADQLLAHSNMPLLAAEQASYGQTAAVAAQALGTEQLERARQRGQAMTLAEVLQFVILKSE
jgi:tetratricopeptide (TPR) repeat protein